VNANPREVKRGIHDRLSDAIQSSDGLQDGLLLRWHCIAEVELPGDRRALLRLSSDGSGADMRSWESSGFLLSALTDTLVDRAAAHKEGR
jgi:hypothetical protein